MLRKIFELCNDREVDLRERLFRVILVIGLLVSGLAMLASIALENVLMNTVPLAMLICIMGMASVATFKYHKIEFAAALIGVVIICGIFPYMFMASGGILGGATVWFVLGILYIFLMFSGKKLVFFLALVVIADVTTYVVSYLHPEWIIALASREEVYYDSLFGVLAVGIAVGCIMKFQLMVYEKEREVTLTQKEELERLGNLKNNFFSSISHEIRTPINTIIGLNEMILREDISEEVAEDAQNVLSAGKMLLSLINDILDLAKIENKKMEIVPVEYKTRELFSELVRLASVRMKEKNLEFIVEIDEALPSVLYGDEKRIRQVVLNLLTNAEKYTERGSVTLSVRGEMAEDTTIKLEIAVADTGIGIKPEDMKNLFDSFQRADIKNNRKIEGSGLGLAIVKNLVNLMEGDISVNSIYGNGSLFTVMLKQQIIDSSPIGLVDYMVTEGEEKKAPYRQSFEAPEAKILIVDDDEKNLMVACKLLRATRVCIDTAGSGKECLEYTKKESYHVILLDHMMQQMDGIETLRRIRRQEDGLCRKAPVIMLTANAAPEDAKRYFEEGFEGYLTKPVDGERLEAEILKFLPEDVVTYRADTAEKRSKSEIVQKILGYKRKKIMITSDCVSDLPKDLRDKYDIRLMYTYIVTEKGSFRDTKEIGPDNFFRYTSDSRGNIYAASASVEEYEAFYAEMLTETENVIHISLSSHVGKSYKNASLAAERFCRVHVIDSEQVSGGEGLMVLYAAHLAKNGYEVDEICQMLEKAKDKIEMSFLLPTVNIFYKNGYTDKFTAKLCEHFGLHPVIKSRRGTLTMCGIQGGKIEAARKRFIRHQLFWKKKINTEIVYITQIGCTVEQQKEVKKEVTEQVAFKKVVMQRGSVSIATNAGFGIVGIAYMKREKEKKEC